MNGRELDEHGRRSSAGADAAGRGAGDAPSKPAASATPFSTIQNQEDAPPCSTCGSIMIRSGACYKCMQLRQHVGLRVEPQHT